MSKCLGNINNPCALIIISMSTNKIYSVLSMVYMQLLVYFTSIQILWWCIIIGLYFKIFKSCDCVKDITQYRRENEVGAVRLKHLHSSSILYVHLVASVKDVRLQMWGSQHWNGSTKGFTVCPFPSFPPFPSGLVRLMIACTKASPCLHKITAVQTSNSWH